MPYIPTLWINGASPPINATNLNKIEAGISNALPIDGSVAMTGGLTLSGNPTLALHATTKQYVDAISYITAGAGLTKTGSTLNIGQGTGIAVGTDSISLATLGTASGSATFAKVNIDAYGRISSYTPVVSGDITALVGTIQNPNIGVIVSGTGLSGGGTFSLNQSSQQTITITSNATSANTASAIVARDTNGDFSTRNISLGGTLITQAGTVGAPSISPTGDSNTGIFFPSADNIAFTQNGTEGLRLNNAGNVVASGNIQAVRFISTQTQGTSPFSVGSSTVVTNLNADLLDGQEGSYYLNLANSTGTLATARGGLGLSSIGTANQILGVNSSATGLEYKTINAGSGIGVANAANSVTISNTGVTGISGTANRVTVSGSTGNVTLNLPQDIATGSTPTFAQISISNTPSADSHAATKLYVDSVAQGLRIKQSVKVATTGNLATSTSTTTVLTLSSALTTLDGVTLSTNDRILVKDQTGATMNGIYVYTNSTTLTRSADANNTPAGEVVAGIFTFVEEGTSFADSGWVLTTDNPITLGTTGLTFAQFSGAGQITAGAGLTKTGNTINVVGTSGRIVANADSIDLVTVAQGSGSSFVKLAIDSYGRVSGNTAVAASDLTTLLTGGASTILTSNLTASRALASDGSGKVAASSVTSTELGYLSGVSSAIQTQLNSKQATITAGTGLTFSGSTLSIANTAVTTGTYKSVTVNQQGQVTAGTNPTTLSGYGITDALTASSTLNADNLTTGTVPLSALSMPTSNNLLRSNLGSPSLFEVGLIESEATNKLIFKLPLSIEYSTDGTTWQTQGLDLNSTAIKNMVIGRGSGSGFTITNGWYGSRVTFRKDSGDFSGGYVFLNQFYSYCSTSGHTMKIIVERSYDGASWSTLSNTNSVSTWPGHIFLSHETIPWNVSPTLGTHYRFVRVTFVPTWNATYPSNNVSISRIDWYGGYPAQDRQVFSWDFDKNFTFPAQIAVASDPTSALQVATKQYVDAAASGAAASITAGTGLTKSGNTISITDTAITPGTYRSLTINQQGQVTAGTNPTTLSGYGITDALSLSGGTLSGALQVGGQIITTAGTAGAPAIAPTGDSNTGIFFPAADTIAFGEGGAEAMRITSAGNVGIGTTNPSTKLEVYGLSGVGAGGSTPIAIRIGASDTDVGANTWNTNADFTQLQFYSNDPSTPGGANVRNSIGSVMESVDGYSSALTFRSYSGGISTERMRITSVGNVGIGTSLPSTKLHVSSTSSTSENDAPLFIQHNFSGTHGYGLIISRDASSISALSFGADSINNGLIAANSSDLRIGKSVSGVFSEAMRITSAGSVGIGTTSPSSRLQVNGSGGKTTFTGTVPGLIGLNENAIVNEYTNIDFRNNSGPVARIGMHYTAAGSRLMFGTSDLYTNGITNTAMTINQYGSVGIGTTSPLSLFHAKSSTDSDLAIFESTDNGSSGAPDVTLFRNSATPAVNDFVGNLIFRGNNLSLSQANYAQIIGQIADATPNAEDGNLLFYTLTNTTPTEKMRITSTGNVGIGTTSPTGDGTVVHIHGTTYASLHLTNNTSGTAVNDGGDLVVDGNNFIIRNRESTGSILFRTNNGASEITINSNGGLKIGDPILKANTNSIVFNNSTTIGGGVNNVAIGEEAFRDSSFGNDNNVIIGYQAAFKSSGAQLSNVAIGAGAMYDTQGAGCVAIGVSTLAGQGAATAFYTTVVGAFAGQSLIGDYNVGVGGRSLNKGDGGASYNASIGFDSVPNLTSGGRNVSIGAQSGYSLTSGGNNAFIGYDSGRDITTGSNNTIIGSLAGFTNMSDTVLIGAGTAERMRINSSGNVGIGTTNPTSKLDIVGSLAFTGAVAVNGSAGSSGQVLISQGTGVAPIWQTISGVSGGVLPYLPLAGGTLTGSLVVQNSTISQGLNTIATGTYSAAFGASTSALDYASFVEGDSNAAVSNSAHAEGRYNLSMQGTAYKILTRDNTTKSVSLESISGLTAGTTLYFYVAGSAPVLGATISSITGATIFLNGLSGITITSNWAYAVRKSTGAVYPPHAEGYNNLQTAYASHIEGFQNLDFGYNANHTEGYKNTNNGNYGSHVEGALNTTALESSHAEGANNYSIGWYSHAEGQNNYASGYASHVEGEYNVATGGEDHAEGYATSTTSFAAHTEGYNTHATEGVLYSITGYSTLASTITVSDATGLTTGLGQNVIKILSFGDNSPQTGMTITAINGNVITLNTGTESIASSWKYLVRKVISGNGGAHSEGRQSIASGTASHAQNELTIASGNNSHSGGLGTLAQGYNQTVIGKYNIAQGTTSSLVNTDHAFIIGNGTSGTTRSNALTINWNGQATFAGGLIIGGTTIPSVNNAYELGSATNRWSTIYAQNALNTSDARLKNHIEPSSLGLSFVEQLNPVQYRWVEGGNIIEYVEVGMEEVEVVPAIPARAEKRSIEGFIIQEAIPETPAVKEWRPVYEKRVSPREGTRTHFGLIAQEVKSALPEGLDFAGWCLEDKNNPDSIQSLGYNQLIAPMIKAIQELSQKVKDLEAKLADK